MEKHKFVLQPPSAATHPLNVSIILPPMSRDSKDVMGSWHFSVISIQIVPFDRGSGDLLVHTDQVIDQSKFRFLNHVEGSSPLYSLIGFSRTHKNKFCSIKVNIGYSLLTGNIPVFGAHFIFL